LSAFFHQIAGLAQSEIIRLEFRLAEYPELPVVWRPGNSVGALQAGGDREKGVPLFPGFSDLSVLVSILRKPVMALSVSDSLCPAVFSPGHNVCFSGFPRQQEAGPFYPVFYLRNLFFHRRGCAGSYVHGLHYYPCDCRKF
jgi:hypothetical protein